MLSHILSKTDHTNLNPAATHEDIVQLIKDASTYHTYSVCIAPYHVLFARTIIDNLPADVHHPKICTVVGFPHGNTMPQTKAFEARNAVIHGADEVDMVINIGALKEKQKEFLVKEIDLVADACQGRVLKVIVETALLTEEEKILACKIVSESAADFIKTSTGFANAGATKEDVQLFKKYLDPSKKIKAAGGISSIEDAETFLALGAARLGSSKIVKFAKQ